MDICSCVCHYSLLGGIYKARSPPRKIYCKTSLKILSNVTTSPEGYLESEYPAHITWVMHKTYSMRSQHLAHAHTYAHICMSYAHTHICICTREKSFVHKSESHYTGVIVLLSFPIYLSVTPWKESLSPITPCNGTLISVDLHHAQDVTEVLQNAWLHAETNCKKDKVCHVHMILSLLKKKKNIAVTQEKTSQGNKRLLFMHNTPITLHTAETGTSRKHVVATCL